MFRNRLTRTAVSLSCVLAVGGAAIGPSVASAATTKASSTTVASHVQASTVVVALVKGSSTGKGSATNDQCVQAAHILNNLSNHATEALNNNNYGQAAQYANAANEGQHNAEANGCSFSAA